MSPDLYTQLLHIPPGPRPPNHYELLGIPLFEEDASVIHAAVLRQSAELKRWALDPDPDRAQRVQDMLNEVNRAGTVLEDPKARRGYQDWLMEHTLELEHLEPESPAAPPEEAAPPPPKPRGATRACPLCGAEMGADDSFCPSCRCYSEWEPALGIRKPAAERPGRRTRLVPAADTIAVESLRLGDARLQVEAAKRHGTPVETTVDLGGGVSLELVLVPAGSFRMGSGRGDPSEKPVHEVKIAKPFYIGKYEVTQEQWQAAMGSNPSEFRDPKKPVESVSWSECKDFVRKLSKKTGRKFSLPSEAEWEYACRAGSTTEYCFGDGEAGLGDYAWYSANANDMTHPVGQKKANKWGLFDMHGNVHEWCEDVWHDSYEGAPTDGSAWVEGGDQGLRVLRGGSWNFVASCCRSAYRYRDAPSDGFVVSLDFGCRVVLRDF